MRIQVSETAVVETRNISVVQKADGGGTRILLVGGTSVHVNKSIERVLEILEADGNAN